MKRLLEKKNNEFYLDGMLLPMNDEVKKDYVDLVFAKLNAMKTDYKTILSEIVIRGNKSVTLELLVREHLFDKLKKEIYLFTKIACSIEDYDNINVMNFSNANSALECSNRLADHFCEYHLIKRNQTHGYEVHLTFDNFEPQELEKEYEEKVLKLKKSN